MFWLLVSSVMAGSVMGELERACDLASETSKDAEHVTFELHFANGETKTVGGADFEKCEIIEEGGYPRYLYLYKGKGGQKQNLMVSLATATHYTLDIFEEYNQWHYKLEVWY
jgi:hypothetical protein